MAALAGVDLRLALSRGVETLAVARYDDVFVPTRPSIETRLSIKGFSPL